MKKLITIIIIGLSFYSCSDKDVLQEKVNVSFDMEDNVMKYGENDWILNLDLISKKPVNEVGLERTDYGFKLTSKKHVLTLKLLNNGFDYKVEYINRFTLKVTSEDNLDSLFYWREIINVELNIID